MTTEMDYITTMLEKVASYDYGVYSLPNGQYAVADPLDDEDGFYLVHDTLEEVLKGALDFIIT